jgi:hypothetical protein
VSNDLDGASFFDRRQRATDAKAAKPTVTHLEVPARATLKAEELDRVRAARAAAKTAKTEAARLSDEAASVAVLDAKRGERKALTKVEAKAKRDARYAARQARR